MNEDTRISGYQPPVRPSEACLVVLHAPVRRLLGARLALGGREAVLGRDGDCDLVLDAADVSRRHARVLPDGDRHVLEDLASTVGVAALAEGEPPEALVARADARLHDAKRRGRDRVVA